MALTKLLTAQWLKDRYLVGIDLTDDDNQPYPDDHYQDSIDAAISQIEATYDISLRRPREYEHTERHDGNTLSSPAWYLKHTRHRPITELISFSIQFGNYPSTAIPLSWVHVVSARAGQIQIIPGPEGFRHPYLVGNTPLLGADILGARNYLPGWIKLKYKAGFEKTLAGTVSGASGQKIVTYTPGSATDSAIQELQEGDHVYVNSTFYRVSDVISSTSFEVSDNLAETWSSETCVAYQYDPLLLQAVGLTAALGILDTAGDLILGAGISSKSISIDGLSESISSTSGVENSGYGARINQYRKRLEDIRKVLLRRYKRMQMMVV